MDAVKSVFAAHFTKGSTYVFTYTLDGDYLTIFLDGKHFYDFVKADKKTGREIGRLISPRYGEVFDEKNITWPRHADGTCDYDNANVSTTAVADGDPDTSTEEVAVSTPAPDMRKIATVTENLRLRTDDKTTAKVVATLAARTRVKVLAPGRDDTIDGITSKWVQVSVLGGAKDKDGNAIEAGTVGWLFGGYLSEVDSTESERANEEASTAKEATALPIVPIAASVVALAVLLAAILLAVKKKKSCKE